MTPEEKETINNFIRVFYEVSNNRDYSEKHTLWRFFRSHEICNKVEICPSCRFWEAFWAVRNLTK